MEKLIVKLPGIRKSMRNQEIKAGKKEDNQPRKDKSSKERVRAFRERLKNDPNLKKKYEESKLKKKAENKVYKAKLKEKREQNQAFDNRCKEKQRMWWKSSQKKKVLKTKQNEKSKNETSQTFKGRSQNNPSAIRKRAQRVKTVLPENSEAWASTMEHLISNATPKRRSLLLSTEPSSTKNSTLSKTLEINKVGRPKKATEKVKKKLAYSENSEGLWNKTKTLSQYKSRKVSQVKRLSKAKVYKQSWKGKFETFLDKNSRVMPNKKDTIKIDGKPVPKYHLLCSKRELYKRFKAEYPSFNRKFTTFCKMIPKNFRRLDLSCRRMCVCTKDYNLEQKVETLNKAASQKSLDLRTTVRQLSNMTLCPYEGNPNRKCIDRECPNCGTQSIQNMYISLVESCKDEQFKYYQWETMSEVVGKKKKRITRWVQVQKKSTIMEIVTEVAKSLESFSGHLFRADFQHRVLSDLTHNLPVDHAVTVMDFSENIALVPQDEIESAHWTVKQVTLHPIYIVRHAKESTVENPVLKKESLVIISDEVTHNSDAVFLFTEKLLTHINDDPGPCPLKVLHRFSDNCAAQYKSKSAFDHLLQLEESNQIKIIYHFSESGHGKGQSDGIGASVKKRLELMILAGKVLNTAYETYLALAQNQNDKLNQKILYVPQKEFQKRHPSKNRTVKTIKGTQSFHMVYQLATAPGVLACYDLSCSCMACIGEEEGPCFYSQYRHEAQYFNLATGKKSTDWMNKKPVASSAAKSAYSTFTQQGDGSLSSASIGDGVENVSSALTDALRQSMLSYKEHLNDVAVEMQNFQSCIATKGWEIEGTTPEDGNCCFWAVSSQLDRLGIDCITHHQLRQKAVSFIKDLPEADKFQISHFLTTDLDIYLEEMSRDGTYADHVCLQMLCKMLSIGAHIVHAATDDIVVCPENPKKLVLGYLPAMEHYVSLKAVERSKPEDFVAVRLSSGRKNLLYLAKIMQVHESGDLQVRYLKSTGRNGVYAWPSKDDVSWQSKDDLICTLSSPELVPGRGLKLKFRLDEIEQCKKDL